MRLSKLGILGCLSSLLCLSGGASAHLVKLDKIGDLQASSHSHSHSHHCPGKCPLNAINYTQGHGSRIELKVDDLLDTDPVVVSLSGFADYLGFDIATTEAYWRLGLEYIECRFGIQTSGITFNPAGGFAFLTVANDGSVVQTPFPGAGTNVIISPITFTGSGTYRCVESTSDAIVTKHGCKPFVRLAEFVLTFRGEISLGGTYGEEATGTPGGRVTTTNGGVAFGRYVIRGKNGYDQYFDMRTWIPNTSFPSGGEISYFSERFQINPLNRCDFGGPGIGSLTIISPTGPINTPCGPKYRWYIRNDWWFGPLVSWPQVVDWDGQCGNTSTILPTGRFAEKCNEVPIQ